MAISTQAAELAKLERGEVASMWRKVICDGCRIDAASL
jgi:hypothetical protein